MESNVNVPLLDLKAQYKAIKPEIMAAIEAVCDEQGFILGPRVVELEQAVAKYVGASHAIGCASGSDALLLSMMAMDIGHGHEVITVPFTFFATAGSISESGARPVFVDVQPDTFNMDPAKIEAKITPRTKAIMPVHLFGQCAEGLELLLQRLRAALGPGLRKLPQQRLALRLEGLHALRALLREAGRLRAGACIAPAGNELDLRRAALFRLVAVPGRRIAGEFYRARLRIHPAVQVGQGDRTPGCTGERNKNEQVSHCKAFPCVRHSRTPPAIAAATRPRTAGSRIRCSSSRLTITPASTSTEAIFALRPTARLS